MLNHIPLLAYPLAMIAGWTVLKLRHCQEVARSLELVRCARAGEESEWRSSLDY